MHFAFDLHDRMECLFSELVSYFNLKMKIAKPLRMILLAHIITDPEVAESIAARRAVPFCEELGFHSVACVLRGFSQCGECSKFSYSLLEDLRQHCGRYKGPASSASYLVSAVCKEGG